MYNRKYFKSNLPRPEIKIVRTREFAGRCCPETWYYKDGRQELHFRIELAAKFLKIDAFLRTTFLHELAHMATHGEKAHHGPRFYKELRRLMLAGAFDKLL